MNIFGEDEARIDGLVVGEVVDNSDPERMGRVRVRLPWQEPGAGSDWARIAVPMAGGWRDTDFLPEVGDEVLVGAENGDPGRLYVLGALWNGKQVPPETDEGTDDRRLIRSRSGHQLLFDDSEHAVVELSLRDGRSLRLDDDGVRLEDGLGNRLTIEAGSGAITIESKAKLTLKSRDVSIEAGARMEIKASGVLKIQGALVEIN